MRPTWARTGLLLRWHNWVSDCADVGSGNKDAAAVGGYSAGRGYDAASSI
jgi:hypothetical protein